MRAVAAAFVLIAGAAVILWYGNTLNSLVLGGLIGGLAALLLSIPISLILFTYIARRHDERMRLEYQDQETDAYTQEHNYPGYQDYQEYDEAPEYSGRVTYIIDGEVEGVYLDEEDESEQVEYDERTSAPRQLPAPRPVQQRLQRQGYGQELPQRDMPSSRSRAPIPQNPAANVTEHEKDITRRSTTGSRHPSRSFGAEVSRSQFQSQALSAARREAAESAARQHSYGEEEPGSRKMPPATSRRFSTMPRGEQSEEPAERNRGARAKNQPQQSTDQVSPRRRPQTEPTMYPPAATRPTPAAQSDRSRTGSRSTQSAQPVYQYNDPETDYFIDEIALDDLKKPLQRRAPYMYEDDPLRQEMAQHLDEPLTRRSSRKLTRRPDNA